MVLETALNGSADALVTFNTEYFDDAANRFTLKLLTPAECIKPTRLLMSQYALRIPDSPAGYAKELARKDNVSLNQFIVLALAE